MTATVDDAEIPAAPADPGWTSGYDDPSPMYRTPSAPNPHDNRRRVLLAAAVVALLAVAGVGAVATGNSEAGTIATASDDAVSDDAVSDDANAPDPDTADADAVGAIQAAVMPDLVGDLGQNELEPETDLAEDDRSDGGCTIGALSIRVGTSGDGVTCLQNALIDEGFLDGAPSGTFDDATLRAAMQYQESADLFVDGVIGRESAIELGIWPDEESLVVHTPAPAPGSMDSMGYRLSPVASTGADAPPLPDNSGSGRRVVYDRGGQRVWAVSDDGQIIRSWLVTGSKYMNEAPGTHAVYSRSDMSTAWNGQAWLPQMIRYQKTEIGAIGFHAIPLHVADNSPYQGVEELGTRLSGGCQRQHNDDSAFMWEFAQVGTPVIVT